MSEATILIVEDEGIVAADLAGKLRRLGYAVAATTGRGEEAVELAVRLRPSLVLMDICLDGPMDGVEAAERIGGQSDVPIVFLTAHSDPATLARAKLAGPLGYVLKPFDDRELAAQIELALYKHQAERQLRQQRESLRESELRVRRKLASVLDPAGDLGVLELADLIDVEAIQAMMDDYYAVARIPMSILDTQGRVLVGVGWQEICTRFHRVHPLSRQRCTESDLELTAGLREGEARLRKCMNGMWDVATPLFVGGQCVGGIFSGQFFFDDETVDREAFRAQARRYDFDEAEYLDALDRVPRLSRECVERGLAFFRKLADMVSRLAYSNVKLARSLAEGERLTASLRASREDLDRAQAVARTGSWRLNVQRNELVWSDEAWRIFGIPRGARLTYESFLEAVHPDDRAEVHRKWSAAMRGEPYDVEHRIVAGGRVKWVRERAELEFDSHGNLLGGFGTTQDITETKRSEERTQLLSEVTAELLASGRPREVVESLCRKVMAHLDCQVFLNYLVDGESGRLHLNASTGIPQPMASQFEWLDGDATVSGCAAKEGQRLVFGHIQTDPQARTDLVRSMGIDAYACHPLLNGGQVIGTLSFGSRTRPAFADDELALMKAVADHVAIAVERERLMTSLAEHARAAEAANEAKSLFLANMSHELRTPMNAILGMIDVALPKAVDATVEDCLRMAKGSADLLLTLLNDLLDSAKIESGKLELESRPFSLRRMLDQITRVLAMRASEKGLSFHCRTPHATPDAVVGDRTRVQQILLNLAGNAIKFTERGEVEIELLARSSGGEAWLEFAVRDTGIGIPPARLDHLFQPFAQADASTTRRFGGTGLGLSISKSLAEMMGGAIEVESEEGAGSTFSFRIRLPLATEAPLDVESPAPAPAPACRPLRILLVEDNPANQKLACYVLQDRGHRVEVAGDGRQAIRLTAENAYDVVLMDVQMPGMDGLEATAAIRRREGAARRLPIVAMTAHAMRGDRQRCLAAGMDGYLSKPVNAHEMIGLIESLAGAAPPPPAQPPEPADAPPPAAAVAFDAERAVKLCYNRQDMAQKMIAHFFCEMDELFPLMRDALARGDLVEFGRLGHRLKGTLAYLAADQALAAALAVERFSVSSDGTPAGAHEALAALQRQCAVLKDALQRHPLGTRHSSAEAM